MRRPFNMRVHAYAYICVFAWIVVEVLCTYPWGAPRAHFSFPNEHYGTDVVVSYCLIIQSEMEHRVIEAFVGGADSFS